MFNPLLRLVDLGQSVWLDYVERGFVRDGQLARLIEEDGLKGVTSNPAIFHKAIVEHRTYDAAIDTLVDQGLRAHEIHEVLIIEDIREVADLLAPVYARTDGRDGFVSLEVSPHLAHDTEGTYWEAKRLAALVERQNLMIKVPGTQEGIPAIRALTADGINVNVTLLFSPQRYVAVADAFISGLEDRLRRGQPIGSVASVASFFLSRIDTLVDQSIDSLHDADLNALRGQSAIASAHTAYDHFWSMTSSARWRVLLSHNARPQRLLWASTGTKDPAYSDVKYVDALVGPDTVTTLPPETLAAYRDHGRPMSQLPAAPGTGPRWQDIIDRFAVVGIEWDTLTSQLEQEGIRKFIAPHEATLLILRARVSTKRR